jgi:transcription termination/antitermination protein NusG
VTSAYFDSLDSVETEVTTGDHALDQALEESPVPAQEPLPGRPADDLGPISVIDPSEQLKVSGDEEVPLPKPSAKTKQKHWYIVHTYSGHENKVKTNLERRIESMNMQHKIFRVESPQKTVTKLKDGKRIERDEKLFPGYVLVEMIMDDDSWHVVRHTPGVTKFVGTQKRPIPAKESEIRRILGKRERETVEKAKVVINLKVGDMVTITSGPFTDFEGTVTEVSPEREKLKATVSIFGRETPVELAFNQVIKL